MPEEVLQELMVNAQMLEEAADAALPHGEMPGGLPGDNFVRLDFLEEGDVEDAEPAPANVREVAPAADRAPPVPEEDGEGDDEDEDVEEIAPLPIRVLRNLVGRFWGGTNAEAEEEASSDEGSQRDTELDGVD